MRNQKKNVSLQFQKTEFIFFKTQHKMKKIAIAMLVLMAATFVYSCAKEKDCICSVENSGSIRRVHLKDGDCIDIRNINDGDGLNEIRVFCMEDTL